MLGTHDSVDAWRQLDEQVSGSKHAYAVQYPGQYPVPAGHRAELDQTNTGMQVNKYPDTRNFKAIGEGGDDFVRSMASAVEQVLGPLQQSCIRQRLSKKQTYVSVTIGPVRVDDSEQVRPGRNYLIQQNSTFHLLWLMDDEGVPVIQVIAIFGNMRQDKRLRFFF